MIYYQVKMTKCDDRIDNYAVLDIKNILESSDPYIGVNDWNNPSDSSCDDFKNNIQKGDIVLVANGMIGIAIVEILSDNYKKRENENGFVNRRKVKILKILDSDESKLPSKSRQSRTVIKSGMNIEYMKELLNDKQNLFSNKLLNIINDSEYLLNEKKQIILYGPSGTGKTYNIKKIIEEHSGEKYEELKKSGRVKIITFHQSFSYEEFIEGIKPELDGKDITYKISNGLFKEFCINDLSNLCGKLTDSHYIIEETNELLKVQSDKSSLIPIPKYILYKLLHAIEVGKITLEDIKNKNVGNKVDVEKYLVHGYPNIYASIIKKMLDNKTIDKNKYLIIDEINRGNISKIFGELITLLESSKRIGGDNELTTVLPYSKKEFGIPSNVYIIGTMNTSDKSIAHLDIALRRRFGFVEMLPDYDLIADNKCRDLLQYMNERIMALLDKDHLIGHSFFINKSETEIDYIMQYEIVPLLEEFFYNDYEKIRLIIGEQNLFAVSKYIDGEEYTTYSYWFMSKDSVNRFNVPSLGKNRPYSDKSSE